MNKERILKLADVIENAPHQPIPPRGTPKRKLAGFNMSNWHCGTVGCIAGWAREIFGEGPYDALDLEFWQADALYVPHGPTHDIQPHHAAAVLRHLAETGKVDWTVQP